MSKRSSTSVLIVAIALRTKMKQKGIKIRSISDVIHGLALPFRAMQQPFIILQIAPMKPILVVIVEMNFPVRGFLLHLFLALLLPLQQNRTGTSGLGICRRCTNLENAIMPKSSLEPIISGSILSIVMPEQVGNGQICLKMHV
jgi:hypothetical protein